MSRFARAWKALIEPPADAKHSAVVTSPRSPGTVSPYRTVNRDRVLEASNIPPGARQQWQLHRVREESRDLELRSAIWGGYVRFSRIQTIGYKLARLQFDRLTKEQKARLGERVIPYLRSDWQRFQTIPNVGGTGRTIHQMAGSVLHHVDVDGDCFLVPRMAAGKRVWDLHPGDALAEQMRSIGGQGGRNMQLGVETDDHGRPVAYYFGSGAKIAPLNWGYYAYGGTESNTLRVPARLVRHIRDRSGEVTAVRGWPRCTTVIELIARADEWFEALSRSAVLRAAVAFALENSDPNQTAPQNMVGRGPGDMVQSTESTPGDGATQGVGSEIIRTYQQFADQAGAIMEVPPGYVLKKLEAGAAIGQEAEAIAMVLRLIAAGLRTSPPTLYGDYMSLSFSAGQLAHTQEREAVEDRQMMMAGQYYGPIFGDRLTGNWVNLVSMFPEIDPTTDMDALLYPTIRLKKYQILDKARLVKSILAAWEQGLMTYPEMRDEIGMVSENPDDTIEEWKEGREKLGLSTTPAPAGKMGDDSDEDDEDDPDKDEKDKDGDDGDD